MAVKIVLILFICRLSATQVLSRTNLFNSTAINHHKVFALILNEDEFQNAFAFYRAALEIAEKRVNRIYENYFRIGVTIKQVDIKCDSSASPVFAAEEYYLRGFDALIGPSCSKGLNPVARMASYWNVPLCTPGGIDAIFNDKNIFTTLTRITFSLDQIESVLLSLLDHFNWTTFAVVVDESDELFLSLMDNLKSTILIRDNLNSNLFTFTRNSKLTRILRRCQRVARIIILIADDEMIVSILKEAYKLSMDNGEYVFLAIDFNPSFEVFDDFSRFLAADINQMSSQIFDSLLVISISQPTGAKYQVFINNTVGFIDSEQSKNVSVNLIVSGAFDCLMTYAAAINKTMVDGDDPFDGHTVTRMMWNSTVDGVIEKFQINSNGDRLADFNLKDFDSESNQMKVVATYYGAHKELIFASDMNIHWPTENNKPPPDVPRCGFSGENPECAEFLNSNVKRWSVFGLALVVIFVFTAIAYRYYREIRLKLDLANNWWRIYNDDIEIEGQARSFGMLLNKSDQINRRDVFMLEELSSVDQNKELKGTVVGTYKGRRVALKILNLKKLAINRELLIDLRQMRFVNHENLVRFFGIWSDGDVHAIVTELCPRGCLRDLIQNDEITIDWPFKFSIIADLVEGMTFVHSNIGFHGRLKSTNCVIDGRFVVKLTNFGLFELARQVNKQETSEELLWTSPEHLREMTSNNNQLIIGSVKGDVYSFAVVLHELITRSAPFASFRGFSCSRLQLTIDEIIERVKIGTTPPFRPEITLNECPENLLDIITQCWNEEPNQRPSFSMIKQQLKKANMGYDSSNFLDNLISRMEQYTDNLEQLADQRTNAFIDEKMKSEELLKELLPPFVADKLKTGQTVQPEFFNCVTICFTDIVEFTRLSANKKPMQVVSLLNDLYTCFDQVIAQFDVYKVETIGDAYMSVSGCPVPNGNRHASEIAKMSLTLINEIHKFNHNFKSAKSIQVRIGIHSGSCVAGVVGLKMPRYCLFGETVNLAQKMEATGDAMRVHISWSTKQLLDSFGGFQFESRDQINSKEFKSPQKTYWLLGQNEVVSALINKQEIIA